MLNLFLALLLDSFSSENIQSIMEEKSNEPNKMAEAKERFSRWFFLLKVKIFGLCGIKIRDKRLDAKTLAESLTMFIGTRRRAVISSDGVDPKYKESKVVQGEGGEIITEVVNNDEAIQQAVEEEPAQEQQLAAMVHSPTGVTKSTTIPSIRPRVVSLSPQLAHLQHVCDMSTVDECCPKCCYILFPFHNQISDSKFGHFFGQLRVKCSRLIEHKYFETTIIVLIIISSLSLAVEDVNTRKIPEVLATLEILDKIFTVIFASGNPFKFPFLSNFFNLFFNLI